MSELLRLLQVEDSESDAALIVRLLERAGYEVRAARVEEAAEMRAALASERWDAIIADHKMAQFDAPGALRVLHEAGLDIPFIVVSGSIGEELAVSLMKSGAHDYLLKQNLARLAPAVEREIREARLREERRRLGEQFRQAQKLESIGRLAGAVAHDFNNLLTVITGYSQMMMAELPLRHPFREQVEEISKAANRAADLTRQLLAFSRRQPAELHALRLNDHVRDVQKMLTRLIGEDIDLSVSLKADPSVIRADAGQLEQVLMNLAVNAKDAMPNGGKLIIETSDLLVDERFSRTHLSVEPGRYVLLTVTDNGAGMAANVKAQLFEPFFTTKEKGKGTGLGLSTVYGIVKQSGGSIWVCSEPGQGSSFHLIFPEAEDDIGADASRAVVAMPSGNETIVVAEDDRGVRKYVREILERHGYTVLQAANGRDALRTAQEHPGAIHLLLSDAVMPEMGGRELAARFGAVRPGVPVLCMSGYSDPPWAPGEVGASFIQKPFTPAALLVQVRAALEAVE